MKLRIVTSTIWLGFLCFLSVKSFGQNWEEVPGTFQDFSAYNYIVQYPDFSHQGFYIGQNGASGESTDKCALSSFVGSFYIAYQIDLSEDYEYRIKWNAKCLEPGKSIQFKWGTSSGSTGSHIGDPVLVPDKEVTEMGEDIQSVAFPGQTGTYYLITTPASTSSNDQSNSIRLDNFSVERRLLDGGEPECEGFAGLDQVICQGESAQLGCSENPTEYCYNWEPEESLDNPFSPSPQASPNTSTVYTVHVTDDEGNYYGSDEVEVVVQDLGINLTADRELICSGQTATLQVEEGFASYQWYKDGLILGETSNSHVTSTAGTYSVIVTNSNDCAESDEIVIGSTEDDNSIVMQLKSQGFICIPITLDQPPPQLGRLAEENKFNDLVDDLTNGQTFQLTNSGYSIGNLENLLEQFFLGVEICNEEGAITSNFRGLITSNSNICEEDNFFQAQNASFNNVDLGYWLHLWDGPGEEDFMLIRVTDFDGATTSSTNLESHLQDLLELVEADSDNYGYSTKEEQLLDITFNTVLDNYADALPIDNTSLQAQYPTTDVTLLPVSSNCSFNNPIVAVAPSGLPIKVEEGSRIAFGVNEKFAGSIDAEALTRFTVHVPSPDRGIYRGAIKKGCNEFLGYKNILKSNQYYQFDISQLGGSPVVASFGQFNDIPCPNKHILVYTESYEFDAGALNNKASGNLVSNFVGRSPAPLDQYKLHGLYLCQPEISEESFNEPLSVNLNPHSGPGDYQASGWIITVRNSDQGLNWIFGAYEQNNDYPTYWWYNCNGEWELYNPPNEELLNILSAFAQVAKQFGHGALDIIGLIPPFGDAADALNGVWYAAEGDFMNAGISAASIGLGFNFRSWESIKHAGKEIKNAFRAFKITEETAASYRVIHLIKEKDKMRNLGFSLAQSERCWTWLWSISNSNGKLAAKFVDNLDYYRVWKNAAEEGLDDVTLTTLFDDIVENEELLGLFKGNSNTIKAWDDLRLRNVPNILRTNVEFLSRLSDNPNLINFIDNLSDGGKIDLANNINVWIKNYDVRGPLKNGNINEAVNILEGSLGTPQVYNGANYVDVLTTSLIPKLNEIVNSSDDVVQVSNNLGIDINIVQTMKEHLFITEHLVEITPSNFVHGRFATFEHIADWWNEVKAADLSHADDLRKLISHEYLEAKLMQEGMLYRTLDNPTSYRYGAHELSSHEGGFNFDHWGDMGRNVPNFVLNSNLDNIDDIAIQIKTIEGL